MLNPKHILATAALALCVATTPAAAAAPSGPGGTRYHSQTSANGEHAALAFSRDGRRVTRAFFNVRLKCSDGATFMDWYTIDNVRVTRQGTFNGTFDTGPVDIATGAETRRLMGSITGRRTRTKVVGTFSVTFQQVVKATGATVTCESGAVRYTATD